MSHKPESQEDYLIFDAFKNGSEVAFQKLFEQHYRRILFFAERFLGHNPMAEDIVAESFLKVWENRMKIKNNYALIAYLQVVTRNACINLIKKDRRQSTGMREFGWLQPLSEDEIQATMIRTELLENSWQLAKALPPAIRKVFDLHFGEGLSVREIALRLGISVNTVKAQRRSALQKIRDIALRKEWLLLIPFLPSF